MAKLDRAFLEDWGITHFVLEQGKTSLMRALVLTFKTMEDLQTFLRESLPSLILYIADEHFLRPNERGLLNYYLFEVNKNDLNKLELDFSKLQVAFTFGKGTRPEGKNNLDKFPADVLLIDRKRGQYVNLRPRAYSKPTSHTLPAN